MIVLGIACLFIGYYARKKLFEYRLNNAKARANEILSDAKKEASNIVREASIEAKDLKYKSKAEFEKETKDRRIELQNIEKRLTQKEENIDRKADLIDRKENELNNRTRQITAREGDVKKKEEEYSQLIQKERRLLESISGLTSEEAKNILMSHMESDARHAAAKTIKKIEDEARETAHKKAKEIISLAIQRYASEQVVESTVSVVDLPNNEIKGRIIGREGRNIRTLEMATGIDLIIDDTPEAVILSGFDPIRREIAKNALQKLIVDGRIHPARIEEVVSKTQKEMETSIKEVGEQVTFELGVHNLHPEEIKLVGRLKYRSSYGQNVLQHSEEVAYLAGIMASELGSDVQMAKRAGLLHDIGKGVDHEVEGSHPKIGAELAKKYGECEEIINAIAAHHGDEDPKSITAVLIQAADAVSAARPGARKESLETYVKRLEKLEQIGRSFKGVENSYAIQAGREIRVIVEPSNLSDEAINQLAKDIAGNIEKELEYPGEIKVTVIRETRAVEYAK
ncbi:ribonuclease Y [bacterium]|nr:ribonuclease Y [bacterium]